MIEAGLGIEIPEKASYIRVITEELERLHSHLIFFAHAFEVLGHETFCYRCFKLREPIMDCLYWLSGNRVHYSVPIVGGVRPRSDITPWKKGKILPVLDELEVEVKKFIDRVLADTMIMSRISGVGILSKETAEKYHAVGPTARASGIAFDWRKQTRDYDRFDFEMIVLEAGDTAARIVARFLEVLECIKIVRQAVTQFPSEGPLINTDWQAGKMDFNDSYLEAPRGELYHSYSLDSTGRVRHYKVRAPTVTNLANMEAACIGDHLTDAVVTIASCDPCLACTNRIIVVEKGKERVIEISDISKGRI